MLKDVKASVSYLSTASFWLAPCFYFVMNFYLTTWDVS